MFATITELKQYLSISTPSEDAKLGNLLGMANEFVSDYTNVNTTNNSGSIVIEDYLPNKTNRMIIDELNIESITSINADGLDLPDVTASLIRGYMVVFSREIGGIIKLTCQYKTTPEVLAGLQALKVAVMELVKFYHKQEYKSSIQSGGESINFDTVSYIPSHVKSILDMYRR